MPPRTTRRRAAKWSIDYGRAGSGRTLHVGVGSTTPSRRHRDVLAISWRRPRRCPRSIDPEIGFVGRDRRKERARSRLLAASAAMFHHPRPLLCDAGGRKTSGRIDFLLRDRRQPWRNTARRGHTARRGRRWRQRCRGKRPPTVGPVLEGRSRWLARLGGIDRSSREVTSALDAFCTFVIPDR
jgi:hypothetical protein